MMIECVYGQERYVEFIKNLPYNTEIKNVFYQWRNDTDYHEIIYTYKEESDENKSDERSVHR